jgi:hypothetical protein
VVDKRTYFFDRHISDVLLRLILVSLFIPSLLAAWFSITRFDDTFEGLFGQSILEQIKDTLDRSVVQAGMGQADLFTAIEVQRAKENIRLQEYPDLLLKFGLAPENPDITAVRLYLFYHRIATWLIAGSLILISLFFSYLILTTYSSGTSNWRIQRAVFGFFNQDHGKTAPATGIAELPLLHRLLFDISFSRSLSSELGEFLFVDREYYEILYPGKKIDEDKLTELSEAFMEMCSKVFSFKHIRNRKEKSYNYCLINPLKGKTTLTSITVNGISRSFFKAGVFRIVTPLYVALKDSYSFVSTMKPEVYSIEREGHPYSYQLYSTILFYRTSVENGKSKELVQNSQLAIPLTRLLKESNITLPEDGLRDFLADIHDDLSHLVSKKAIDSWRVTDNGIPLAIDWYEAVRSFSFSPDSNEFKRGIEIIASKVYCFEIDLPDSSASGGPVIRRLPASIE